MGENKRSPAISDYEGLIYRVDPTKQPEGDFLGPLVVEITDNGHMFLKSLNKSWVTQGGSGVKVGYMVMGDQLHFHCSESDGGFENPKWKRVEYNDNTGLTVDDLIGCSVIERTLASREIGGSYRDEITRVNSNGQIQFFKTDIPIQEVYVKSERVIHDFKPDAPIPFDDSATEDIEPETETSTALPEGRKGEWMYI